VGNHGVEGLSEFREQRTQARQATRAWRKQAEPILKKIQGADLEDKELSLTIHYRFSKRPRQAKAALLALAQVLKPTPRLVLGKWVVNLVWPGSATKGSAVQALMKRSGARRALYVGDDVTDEDVFRLPSSKIFSIRVGRKLRSLAPFYIPAQRDVDTLLRAILRFID
jgi:trehalose 6-phosphate phosphatase